MNGKKTNSIIIRSARSEDIVEVAKKIKELARFEKMEHIVKVTVDQLLKDGGFLSKNDPKLYELLIAETENDRKLIGYAMWSYTYSSCEGKIAHLQDLLIDEKFRRQGIAKQFFSLISKEVIEQNGAYLKLNGKLNLINHYFDL